MINWACSVFCPDIVFSLPPLLIFLKVINIYRTWIAYQIIHLNFMFCTLFIVLGALFYRIFASKQCSLAITLFLVGIIPLSWFYFLKVSCFIIDEHWQVSLGYFLADLGMIFWVYPSLGGKEYVSTSAMS